MSAFSEKYYKDYTNTKKPSPTITQGDRDKVDLILNFMEKYNMDIEKYSQTMKVNLKTLTVRLQLFDYFSDNEWYSLSSKMREYEQLLIEKAKRIKHKVIKDWQVRNLMVYGNTIIMKSDVKSTDKIVTYFKEVGLNVELVDTGSDHYVIKNLDSKRNKELVNWASAYSKHIK